MGNTGLLRREAEITLLQPELGELRCQELKNSSFWHSKSLNWLRSSKTSSSKKAPLKTLRVLDPTKTSPFMVPTRKEATTGNAPMGAVTNHFPQAGGNLTSEAPGVVFNPTTGDEGVETPPPMTI